MTIPVQPRTQPPTPEDIKAQYGFVALIAQQIPEIGALMQQAVAGNWTSDRFSLALASTGWWKQTPEAQRQWIVRTITDPASAEADIVAGSSRILGDLQEIGLHPYNPDGTARLNLRDLYVQARIKGLDGDDNARRAWLFSVGNQASEWDTQGGRYGQMVTEMVKMAQEYGYNAPGVMHEITGAANAAMLGGGNGNTEYWKRKLIGYAKAKYTAFADRFDAGETVADVARPYLDSYAQVLEQPANFHDALVQKALQGAQPQAGQPPTAKPVWQFEQELRKDARWGKTDNAKQAAAQTLNSIGKAFGMIG